MKGREGKRKGGAGEGWGKESERNRQREKGNPKKFPKDGFSVASDAPGQLYVSQ